MLDTLGKFETDKILRRSARDGCRQGRRPDGLGASAARFGPAYLYRFARPRGSRADCFQPGAESRSSFEGQDLRSEFVVAVEGRVIRRQKSNPEIPTGEVEVVASRLHILNNSKTPPFLIEDEVTASEETRFRYRYLDLRRPRLHSNIELRHRVVFEIRKALDEMGFFEIETPILTARLLRARGTAWSRAGFITGSFTRCRNRRKSSSRY